MMNAVLGVGAVPDEISHVFREHIAQLQRRDLKAILESYVADAFRIESDGSITAGRAALERHFTKVFGVLDQGLIIETEALAGGTEGDLAWVSGETFTYRPEGAYRTIVRHARFGAVLVRRAETFKFQMITFVEVKA